MWRRRRRKSGKARPARVNFLLHAVRDFQKTVPRGLLRTVVWRARTQRQVDQFLMDVGNWLCGTAGVVLAALALLLFLYLARSLIGPSVGAYFCVLVLLLLATPVVVRLLAGELTMDDVVNTVFGWIRTLLLVLIGGTLYLWAFVWAAAYTLYKVGVVVAEFLLLVPLFVLFVWTRGVQLWKGIFYTCPSRRCAYRGLPAYVCPQGHVVDRLWPSLYGVWRHHCPQCDAPLPTLDWLGRRKLAKRCGHPDCRMPLLGRHAGLVPEQLVAIVGGPSSGKTSYLLAAVDEVISGRARHRQFQGEIDDPGQETRFEAQWAELAGGRPAGKTMEVAKAFLLYVEMATKKCQLYLYDAPGEEFVSISSMSKQQYFPLLAGLVLLVDPMGFEAIGGRRARQEKASLDTVVSTTLGTALGGMRPGTDGKYDVRVAVVISKADLPAVRETIGDVRERPIRSAKCRKAIEDWGGRNAIRALEQRFRAVKYFACSPLGRTPGPDCREPLQGSGLLEPLEWILDDKAT